MCWWRNSNGTFCGVQVLFCSLSAQQRQLYQAYLHSRDVADILEGRRTAMEGITLLRKICNHADLLHRTELQVQLCQYSLGLSAVFLGDVDMKIV